jgi:hypothetical protein
MLALTALVFGLATGKQPKTADGLLSHFSGVTASNVTSKPAVDGRETVETVETIETIVEVGNKTEKRIEKVDKKETISDSKPKTFDTEIAKLEKAINKLAKNDVKPLGSYPGYLDPTKVAVHGAISHGSPSAGATAKPMDLATMTTNASSIPDKTVSKGMGNKGIEDGAEDAKQAHHRRALRTITSFFLGGLIGRLLPVWSNLNCQRKPDSVDLEALASDWPEEMLSV